LEVLAHTQVVLKCITVDCGEQCVMMDSITQTQVLFADLSVTGMFYKHTLMTASVVV